MEKKINHHLFVDEWIRQNFGSQSKESIVYNFNRAFQTIWLRAKLTLSEITLTPIFDRVLHVAKNSYKWLEDVKLNENGYDVLGINLNEVPVNDLRAGLTGVLINLISVLGNLTAEALTKQFYKELTQVGAEILNDAIKSVETSKSSKVDLKKGTSDE